jgi:hypothetical protein
MCTLCGYCYNLEHVTKDYPDLLKKWEEKKTHCNMVTTEPHTNKKKDDEVDVWVIICGGEKIGWNSSMVKSRVKGRRGR